jgi:hypothetical protein
MIDANALLRRWISEGLNTQRVSATVLPQYEAATDDGFNPQSGPWIVISTRGGLAHPEAPIITPSLTVRVWAGFNQFDVARARYLEVFDLIHQQTSVDFGDDGYVISCSEEVQGQDVTDPETGYATVIADFGMKCTSNEFRNQGG